MTLPQAASILRDAISPAILINGVGLLLLTMTNRLARVVDRSRAVLKLLESSPDDASRQRYEQLLEILRRRGKLVRQAIELAILSLLCDGLLIVVLFLDALTGWDSGLAISVLFSLSTAGLLVSLAAFLREVHLALRGMELEFDRA